MQYILCPRCQFKVPLTRHLCATCGYSIPASPPARAVNDRLGSNAKTARSSLWRKWLGVDEPTPERQDQSQEEPALS